MQTYKELYNIVNPTLTAYREDLTNHDKKTLDNYTGPFLYGHRATGTDILPLRTTLTSEQQEWIKDLQIRGCNTAYILEQVQTMLKSMYVNHDLKL